MQKHYYDAASLERLLQAFEKRFELDSETFLRAHVADDEAVVGHVSRFLRHGWASFYLDWKRLRGDDFGAKVEDELQLA